MSLDVLAKEVLKDGTMESYRIEAGLLIYTKNMHHFLTILKELTNHKERNVKRHAHALLKQLQELNPQDDN